MDDLRKLYENGKNYNNFEIEYFRTVQKNPPLFRNKTLHYENLNKSLEKFYEILEAKEVELTQLSDKTKEWTLFTELTQIIENLKLIIKLQQIACMGALMGGEYNPHKVPLFDYEVNRYQQGIKHYANAWDDFIMTREVYEKLYSKEW